MVLTLQICTPRRVGAVNGGEAREEWRRGSLRGWGRGEHDQGGLDSRRASHGAAGGRILSSNCSGVGGGVGRGNFFFFC